MIIGGEKNQVILNMQEAIRAGELNRKVEEGDPSLSPEDREALLGRYLTGQGSYKRRCRSYAACKIRDVIGWTQNRDTQIAGLEQLAGLEGGAIVTSNHFNPLDSTIIRALSKRAGKKRLYIVSQETNFAMTGFLGFLMNYADTIPISTGAGYMEKEFVPLVSRILGQGDWVLIYPEQEMWFNYRKPRPPKRGAYYLAAKCHVPVLPCFVEIRDEDEWDTEEFRKVSYILHVLPLIFPEQGKTVRENSIAMMWQDYKQKSEAYERSYGQPLTYDFSPEDIAGWAGATTCNSMNKRRMRA